MKIKLFLISILSFIATMAMAQKSYETQWKQVEKYENDNLPKSALGVVETILKQSLAGQNHQQAIKAMIYRNKFKKEIDDNVKPELITDFSNLLSGKVDAVEKSLIHSLIAELYQTYYNENRWQINQRTAIVGYVPDDMAEWSRNIFQSKILTELDASLKDVASLSNTKAETYSTVIDLGKDSRDLFPSMSDFVLQRAINISSSMTDESDLSIELKKIGRNISDLSVPASDFIHMNLESKNQSLIISTLTYYQKFLASLHDRRQTEGFILTDLNRINFIAEKSAEYNQKYKSNALLGLEKENESNPMVVEIIGAIADYYSSTENSPEKKYEWLKKGIALYPNARRTSNLKNELAQMENPEANISGKKVFYPNEKKTVELNYKNLNRVTVSIFRSNGTKVKEMVLNLHPKETYSNEKQILDLDIREVGNYYAEISFDKKFEKNNDDNGRFNFMITNLLSLNKQITDGKYAVYVTDRENGKPLSNISVTVFEGKYNATKTQLKTIQTNAKGLAELSIDKTSNMQYFYKIADGTDAPDIFTSLNRYYYFRDGDTEDSKPEEHVTLLTDRSIYRPGQAVYFKLIATEGANGEDTVLANKPYEVKLYDANRQEVAKKTLTTNEFGSSSSQFILPQGLLGGQFYISAENKSNVYFRVEEYKRPTFQVRFDKVEKTYQFGEKILIKGHAENFSGIKLQDANVHYTVTRQRLNLWRWFNSSSNQTQIADETVKTTDEGSFEVSFIPQKEDEDAESKNSYFPSAYLFTVKATVTDVNGETQSEEYYLRVADVSMILNVNLDKKYDKDAGKEITIKATNLDGNEIPAKGDYIVYALDNNDSIASQVLTGDFTVGRQMTLEKELKKLPSGKYRIVVKAADSNGKAVQDKSDFVLYSLSDKRPPYKTNDWLMEKNTQIAPDKPVEVIVGVSDKDVYVLYELSKGYEILESQIMKLSNENRLFTLPYDSKYEENTTMTFTLIRDGKMVQHRVEITKTEKQKDLQLKFNVFRDKLRPGQKEEWRITVRDSKGQPAVSEVLASMYDQSLDKIYRMNHWQLNLSQKQNGIFSPLYQQDGSFDYGNLYFNFITHHFEVKDWTFDEFNWFGYNDRGLMMLDAAPIRIRGMASNSNSREVLNEVVAVGYGVKKEKVMTGSMAEDKAIIEKNTTENTPQIRTNFNETAFFYPQLRTNERGETVISFTVPESNTTWKFRALAYDKNMNTGQLQATVVTRKELMITPNLPRFVRIGDKTSVSTKISNLSDTTVSGKVRVEFFNPMTDEVVNLEIANSEQTFDLRKGASSSASWTFVVPENFDILGCRMVAESETFSDGEQHVIPVLPDKMLVTESLPLYVRGGQSKQFSFDHLLNNQSSTLKNNRLTLEFSANPAWYAVQALPTLSNPDNDNAVSWFASYYVNTLGTAIPKLYPQVASMIQAWQLKGGTKETLYSALQKNEELKNVLLQETPWVLDAKDETEQKQQLALLFDLNRSQSLTSAALRKLADLQTEQGGWSWYKGFYPSRSITQYVLYGFAQLVNLNVVEYSTEVKQMQIKALKYVDKQIAQDFADLKKYDKNWANLSSISVNQLEYLYVRSFYRDIPISKEAREAERFYTSVVASHWTNLNLYEQSLLAVLEKKNANLLLVNKIMASLREHATTRDEMGMFWANNKSSVFFSKSAVAVHTFLMEAFKECGTTAEEMDNLKLWLLKQKQTERWESTHGTLLSIYALLSTGSDWLASKGEVTIRLGNTQINTSDKELGTGYMKQSWDKSAMQKEMGKVSVTKKDNGTAYGAIYWQYFENLDKIEGQSNKELNVTKMLFKEVSSESGKVLQPIAENGELHVGDKVVVRLVVRADRDMEFVQLKDMRASCFEPTDQISGVQWNGGTIYYRTTLDASTNFYFDHLPKGTYTFEYGVYVARTGEYKNGITSIQCLYAPEFTSHTAGVGVKVD